MKKLFRSVDYFKSLDDKYLDEIIAASVRQEYEPNEIVFFEGDLAKGLYLIESGWVKAYRSDAEGRESILATRGPGHTFNTVALFIKKMNLATAQTLEKSVIWYVPTAVIDELLTHSPLMAKAVIQDLADHVDSLVQKVESVTLHSVEKRLADYLLLHRDGMTVSRESWATQAEIAAQLGTVNDVLNRTLRKFVELNILKVERKQIEILDIDQLQSYANPVADYTK